MIMTSPTSVLYAMATCLGLVSCLPPITGKPPIPNQPMRRRVPVTQDYGDLQAVLGNRLSGSNEENIKIIDLLIQLLEEIDLPTLCDVIANDTSFEKSDNVFSGFNNLPGDQEEVTLSETNTPTTVDVGSSTVTLTRDEAASPQAKEGVDSGIENHGDVIYEENENISSDENENQESQSNDKFKSMTYPSTETRPLGMRAVSYFKGRGRPVRRRVIIPRRFHTRISSDGTLSFPRHRRPFPRVRPENLKKIPIPLSKIKGFALHPSAVNTLGTSPDNGNDNGYYRLVNFARPGSQPYSANLVLGNQENENDNEKVKNDLQNKNDRIGENSVGNTKSQSEEDGSNDASLGQNMRQKVLSELPRSKGKIVRRIIYRRRKGDKRGKLGPIRYKMVRRIPRYNAASSTGEINFQTTNLLKDGKTKQENFVAGGKRSPRNGGRNYVRVFSTKRDGNMPWSRNDVRVPSSFGVDKKLDDSLFSNRKEEMGEYHLDNDDIVILGGTSKTPKPSQHFSSSQLPTYPTGKLEYPIENLTSITLSGAETKKGIDVTKPELKGKTETTRLNVTNGKEDKVKAEEAFTSYDGSFKEDNKYRVLKTNYDNLDTENMIEPYQLKDGKIMKHTTPNTATNGFDSSYETELENATVVKYSRDEKHDLTSPTNTEGYLMKETTPTLHTNTKLPQNESVVHKKSPILNTWNVSTNPTTEYEHTKVSEEKNAGSIADNITNEINSTENGLSFEGVTEQTLSMKSKTLYDNQSTFSTTVSTTTGSMKSNGRNETHNSTGSTTNTNNNTLPLISIHDIFHRINTGDKDLVAESRILSVQNPVENQHNNSKLNTAQSLPNSSINISDNKTGTKYIENDIEQLIKYNIRTNATNKSHDQNDPLRGNMNVSNSVDGKDADGNPTSTSSTVLDHSKERATKSRVTTTLVDLDYVRNDTHSSYEINSTVNSLPTHPSTSGPESEMTTVVRKQVDSSENESIKIHEEVDKEGKDLGKSPTFVEDESYTTTDDKVDAVGGTPQSADIEKKDRVEAPFVKMSPHMVDPDIRENNNDTASTNQQTVKLDKGMEPVVSTTTSYTGTQPVVSTTTSYTGTQPVVSTTTSYTGTQPMVSTATSYTEIDIYNDNATEHNNNYSKDSPSPHPTTGDTHLNATDASPQHVFSMDTNISSDITDLLNGSSTIEQEHSDGERQYSSNSVSNDSAPQTTKRDERLENSTSSFTSTVSYLQQSFVNEDNRTKSQPFDRNDFNSTRTTMEGINEDSDVTTNSQSNRKVSITELSTNGTSLHGNAHNEINSQDNASQLDTLTQRVNAPSSQNSTVKEESLINNILTTIASLFKEEKSTNASEVEDILDDRKSNEIKDIRKLDKTPMAVTSHNNTTSKVISVNTSEMSDTRVTAESVYVNNNKQENNASIESPGNGETVPSNGHVNLDDDDNAHDNETVPSNGRVNLDDDDNAHNNETDKAYNNDVSSSYNINSSSADPHPSLSAGTTAHPKEHGHIVSEPPTNETIHHNKLEGDHSDEPNASPTSEYEKEKSQPYHEPKSTNADLTDSDQDTNEQIAITTGKTVDLGDFNKRFLSSSNLESIDRDNLKRSGLDHLSRLHGIKHERKPKTSVYYNKPGFDHSDVEEFQKPSPVEHVDSNEKVTGVNFWKAYNIAVNQDKEDKRNEILNRERIYDESNLKPWTFYNPDWQNVGDRSHYNAYQAFGDASGVFGMAGKTTSPYFYSRYGVMSQPYSGIGKQHEKDWGNRFSQGFYGRVNDNNKSKMFFNRFIRPNSESYLDNNIYNDNMSFERFKTRNTYAGFDKLGPNIRSPDYIKSPQVVISNDNPHRSFSEEELRKIWSDHSKSTATEEFKGQILKHHFIRTKDLLKSGDVEEEIPSDNTERNNAKDVLVDANKSLSRPAASHNVHWLAHAMTGPIGIPAPKDYTCPSMFGYYMDPQNCRSFFVCSWGVPYRLQCPPGTRFNPEQSVCDWAVNVPCELGKAAL